MRRVDFWKLLHPLICSKYSHYIYHVIDLFRGLFFLFIYLILIVSLKVCNHLVSISAGVHDFIPDYQPSPMTDSGLSSSSTSSSISLGNTSAAISQLHTTILNEVDISVEQDEKVKTLIEFITSR